MKICISQNRKRSLEPSGSEPASVASKIPRVDEEAACSSYKDVNDEKDKSFDLFDNNQESILYGKLVSKCEQKFSSKHLLLPGTDILRQKVGKLELFKS